MAKKPTKRSAEFAKQVKAGTAKKRKAKPAKQRKKAERVYSYKPRPQKKEKMTSPLIVFQIFWKCLTQAHTPPL